MRNCEFLALRLPRRIPHAENSYLALLFKNFVEDDKGIGAHAHRPNVGQARWPAHRRILAYQKGDRFDAVDDYRSSFWVVFGNIGEDFFDLRECARAVANPH